MQSWRSSTPSRHVSILLFLLCISAAIIAVPNVSNAQFIPCNIVNLSVSAPDSVQSGQLLQVTTTLQISCDPSIYPVIRLDLLDGRTSNVLSSASVPYPPSLSAFTVTGINQATAPSATGNWRVEVQAYVINGITGRVAASSAQSFSVNVVPYTPSVTITTQESPTISISVVTAITPTLSSPTTSQAAVTESQMTQPSQTSSSASTSNTSVGYDFTQLLPVALVVVVLGIIGIFIVGARKRRPKSNPTHSGYCGQCGAELLRDAKFCGKCGAKQS